LVRLALESWDGEEELAVSCPDGAAATKVKRAHADTHSAQSDGDVVRVVRPRRRHRANAFLAFALGLCAQGGARFLEIHGQARRSRPVVPSFVGIVNVNVPAVMVCDPNVYAAMALSLCVLL